MPTGFVKMKSEHVHPIVFEVFWELSPMRKKPCEDLVVPKCLRGDISKDWEVGWKHASHTHIERTDTAGMIYGYKLDFSLEYKHEK